MVTISLSDTSLAYMAAVGLITTLLFLAKRNQKQGWRKQRSSFMETQFAAANRAFARPQPAIASESHLADLGRLQQALNAHGEPKAPQSPTHGTQESNKSNVLA